MPFKIFLGIDQNGSLHKDGSAKSLSVAAIYKDKMNWNLESDLALPHLNKQSVEALIHDLNPRFDISNVVIILDSALGLPRSLFPKNKTIFDLMVRAHRFSDDGKRINPKTANAFFAQFLENTQGPPPRRECEIKLDAHSLFHYQPFQKNAGVGTFRSWSDLGSSQNKWFNIWPFDDPNKDGPWLFEAHSTHFWKTTLKSPDKDCSVLKEALERQKFLQIHSSTLRSLQSADLCDAIMLVYGGFILHRRRKLFQTPHGMNLKKEGWILGV